jgi:uncharacterized protein YceH (UPF0502 family)
MVLDPNTLRVLGSLMEKEMTTPENYPLSLNSLLSASNQRSSREPVMELTEEDVRQSLHLLADLALVTPTRDARVPKYEHRIRTVLNLRRDETAVLCLLLLRGPQTPGELRGRSDRMFAFDDLPAVQSTLDRLAARTEAESGPLVAVLPRQPGSSVNRWMHLLGGTEIPTFAAETRPAAETSSLAARVAELEATVQRLDRELSELRQAAHSE